METFHSERNGIWKLTKSINTNKTATQKRNRQRFWQKAYKQCSSNNRIGNDDIEDAANKNIAVLDEQLAEPVRHSTLGELTSIIKHLNKALGQDGIINKAVKLMPYETKFKLLHIFSACMLSIFPAKWKSSVIITIPKTRKRSLSTQKSSSYQPTTYILKIF